MTLPALALLMLAQFDVASVKPTANGGPMSPTRFMVSPDGRLTVTNMPLHLLIARAWNLPPQSKRLSGGPEWVRSDTWDIQAVAPDLFPRGISAKAREERVRGMLRQLLTERFGLVVRTETKQLSVYQMVAAKRLKPADIDEQACPVQPADDGIFCHHLYGDPRGGLIGPAVDMTDLALELENWLDRPVIDRTGIRGLYNVQTKGWTEGDVFGELEAAIGLRLKSSKARAEVFSVDRVSRPSSN